MTQPPWENPKPSRSATMSFRLSARGREWVSKVAAETGVPASEVVRVSLALAKTEEKKVIALIQRRAGDRDD